MTFMYKKLTITVEEKIYNGLKKVIGERNISKFLSELARPYVIEADLEKAYREMSQDEEREKEAHLWSENLITDSYDEKR